MLKKDNLWEQRVIDIAVDDEHLHLNYYVAGKGNSIIFLHGWLHSGKIWRNMLPLTNHGYHLIAPDLPGFGKTRIFSQKKNINIFSALTKKILDYFTKENDPPIIVADSLSAVVMLRVFVESHTDCSHLILLGCPSDGLPNVVKFLRKATPFSSFLGLLKRQHPSRLHTLVRHMNILTMKHRTGNLKPLIYALKSVDIQWSIVLIDAILYPLPDIPRLSMPTTILRGEFDNIVSRKTSKVLSKKLRADYLEVKSSGHTPMIEQPEKLIGMLRKILSLPK